jgi:type IV pilus assembly protein PilV
MDSSLRWNDVPQTGATFIENLIAVVVLSVGLLGVASMSLAGFRHNHGALLRSQAAMLAADILERMRANPDQAYAGNYNILLTAPPPTGAPDCLAGTCDPAQLTSFDLSQWLADLAARLPAGDGAVQLDTATPRNVTVTIRWSESGGTASQLLVHSRL